MPKFRQFLPGSASAASRYGRSAMLVVSMMAVAGRARADADLLVEEPINLLGQIAPTGHVASDMEQLCPQSPVQLRVCEAGESGAVIGRYKGIGGFDWLAMTPGAYLYAVDAASGIPTRETLAGLVALRAAYVDEHQADELAGLTPKQWDQLLGEAYRRQILVVHIHTTPEHG
jgi:hypothetical protein